MREKLVERIIELTSSGDTKQIPLTVLKTLSETLSAQCLLYTLKQDKGGFFLECGYGEDWDTAPTFYPLEGSLLGKCILASKEMEIVRTQNEDLEAKFKDGGLKKFTRALYLPIHSGDRPAGVLCIKGGNGEEGFSNAQKSALIVVTRYLSNVWNLLQMLKDREVHIRELSFFHEVDKALMTTMNLDKLMYIILAAVTVEDGIGSNRAMLFLINEPANVLQGMMAVGPDDVEEARRVWEGHTINKQQFLDLIHYRGDVSPHIDSKLNETIKSIRLPLDEKSILTCTVNENKAFNILDADNSVYNCREIVDKLGSKTFATIPLIALEKALGVIVVDNVYNMKPITRDDIGFLTTFCNQAGIAIENALLYNNIKETLVELKKVQGKRVQREKLAALGEMAATLAHEIRNPLVSIGGFVRRLGKELERVDPIGHLCLTSTNVPLSEKVDQKGSPYEYLDRIKGEVLKLEKILNDVLNFSKEDQPHLKIEDLNIIIQETLENLEEEFDRARISVVKYLFAGQLLIKGDGHLLNHVFVNLISNSLQAMERVGTLTIRSYPLSKDGKDWVVAEVEDTGGGIEPDLLENIFNPFFTTKKHGTGLGLAVTNNMVTSHNGFLEVKNNVGKGGATFVIKLPAYGGEIVKSEDNVVINRMCRAVDHT